MRGSLLIIMYNYSNNLISTNLEFNERNPWVKCHRIIIKEILHNFNLALSKCTDIREMYQIMQNNNQFEQSVLQKLEIDNVSYIIQINLEFFLVMQALQQTQQIFTLTEVEGFLWKIISFGLNYFGNKEEIEKEYFTSHDKIKKVQKKIKLLHKICQYLKIVKQQYKKGKVFVIKNENLISRMTGKGYFEIISASNKNFVERFQLDIECPYMQSIGVISLQASHQINNEIKINDYISILMIIIGNEIDRIKGYFFINLKHIENYFTIENKSFNKKQLIQYYQAMIKINPLLAFTLHYRIFYKLGNFNEGIKMIAEAIAQLPLLYYENSVLLEHFIDFIGLNSQSQLQDIFYWKVPHIQILLKYLSEKYEHSLIIQLFLIKQIFKMKSNQILFYFSQLFQSLGLASRRIYQKCFLKYGQQSQLFAHQLIWKSQVEAKIEEKDQNKIFENHLRVQKSAIQIIVLMELLLNSNQFLYWKNVENFFENITGISGKLLPSQSKEQKKKIIAEELVKIQLHKLLYLPTNPNMQINQILLDSGRPMQSKARVPILISFICHKFEGPESFPNLISNKDSVQKIHFYQQINQIIQYDESMISSDDDEHGCIQQIHPSCIPQSLPQSFQKKNHGEIKLDVFNPVFKQQQKIDIQQINEKIHQLNSSEGNIDTSKYQKSIFSPNFINKYKAEITQESDINEIVSCIFKVLPLLINIDCLGQ